MRGKTVVITGSTRGIGKATATELARRGATVVGIGRTLVSSQQAEREIRAASGSGGVHMLVADLASQAEVRQVATEILSRHERVDVLINNAATMRWERTLTEDGLETIFAVNYLAPFLLTYLLLPRLRASAPSRIINVVADSQRQGQIRFDNLQGEQEFSFFAASAQAKLALLMFTYELAERLEGTGVTANALHPGFHPAGASARYLPRPAQWVLKVLDMLPLPFIKNAAEAAETSIYLAASPEVAEMSGEYFIDKEAVPSAEASYDRATRQRLWEVSVELAQLQTSLPPA